MGGLWTEKAFGVTNDRIPIGQGGTQFGSSYVEQIQFIRLDTGTKFTKMLCENDFSQSILKRHCYE